ncbi:saccharopine dehydrogenase NADP-binding domain-containing protein [Agrococcus sp. ProA11]|uniref:saccharopine dehydrogenase family protein n=1 Tax=Agrococcus chionoecetis TaxID=3153752 RepID=UPI003260422D
MAHRDLDLTLFGATGFVGRLVAAHLAYAAPAGLRVALAGRSRERLEAVRAGLGPVAAGWPLVVADSDDHGSLRALVERSRVVVTTVGPYQRHGLPLAAACAEAGTDYADLTGEVLFVRELIERCHDTARASGARIVVSCGFDSVPSDLAVQLLHRQALADRAGALGDTTMRVRRLQGGVSGGTLDSLRLQQHRVAQDPALGRILADPAALSGGAPIAAGQRDVRRPFLDAETGEWNAPFVMAGYNTRVVRRSDALAGGAYGDEFRYREVLPTGRGVGGRIRAAAIAAAMAVAAAMATPWLGGIIDRVLPAPGEGPSEQRRSAGSFRLETTTRTSSGRAYRATVAAQGDPGYAATAVMLGEAGLSLAVDGDRCSAEGGVLTPAVAMGDVLVDRLRAQGFTLETAPAGRSDR